MLLCIVYGRSILFVNTVNTKIKVHNALNAMFVETVNTGVCDSYTTLYTEYYEVWKLYSTLYKAPLAPPRGKTTVGLLCLPSSGFSCSPVWGGSFVNFLGLVNYKGDWVQDAQPIPIF